MNDIILGRKLRNAIEKHIQGMEYHLHTIEAYEGTARKGRNTSVSI